MGIVLPLAVAELLAAVGGLHWWLVAGGGACACWSAYAACCCVGMLLLLLLLLLLLELVMVHGWCAQPCLAHEVGATMPVCLDSMCRWRGRSPPG